jgi:hypothetical protein
MRETFGVAPVAPADRRARSRVPLWAWISAAVGLGFVVTGGLLVHSVVSGQGERGALDPFSPQDELHSRANPEEGDPSLGACEEVARRIDILISRSHRCGDDDTAEALLEARTALLVDYEIAHDDASKRELAEACEMTLHDLPEDVCR